MFPRSTPRHLGETLLALADAMLRPAAEQGLDDAVEPLEIEWDAMPSTSAPVGARCAHPHRRPLGGRPRARRTGKPEARPHDCVSPLPPRGAGHAGRSAEGVTER
jgi:hypothetical protein